MPTLNEIALSVAKILGRANPAGTSIVALEGEIKDAIRDTVRFYNRQAFSLTELRGLTLTTTAGQTFYSTVSIATAEGEQSIVGRPETLPVEDIVRIHYMRESPGASGLNEPLGFVRYEDFERLQEGATPSGTAEYYTRYGNQIGIWPVPDAAYTLYMSGHIKPAVPQADNNENVWFAQAKELIRYGAARRVMSEYIRDVPRAQEFAQLEALERENLQSEYVRKASSGRLKIHG